MSRLRCNFIGLTLTCVSTYLKPNNLSPSRLTRQKFVAPILGTFPHRAGKNLNIELSHSFTRNNLEHVQWIMFEKVPAPPTVFLKHNHVALCAIIGITIKRTEGSILGEWKGELCGYDWIRPLWQGNESSKTCYPILTSCLC